MSLLLRVRVNGELEKGETTEIMAEEDA